MDGPQAHEECEERRQHGGGSRWGGETRWSQGRLRGPGQPGRVEAPPEQWGAREYRRQRYGHHEHRQRRPADQRQGRQETEPGQGERDREDAERDTLVVTGTYATPRRASATSAPHAT
ncbi:hypothetical protein [Streptomyces sp. NPDC005859]|uniref:hypothetical protein n=1 Tax=Streptomyces sp. NPDC005859 TaxID=3157170 RepID=UPI0033F4D6B2